MLKESCFSCRYDEVPIVVLDKGFEIDDLFYSVINRTKLIQNKKSKFKQKLFQNNRSIHLIDTVYYHDHIFLLYTSV